MPPKWAAAHKEARLGPRPGGRTVVNMFFDDPLSSAVRRLLSERGQVLFGEETPLRSVAVRRKRHAVVAALTFDSGPRRVVAKRVQRDAHVSDAAELLAAHERIRSRSDQLRESTPRFLAAFPELRLVLMEFIPGDTLLDVLKASLRVRRPSDACCDALLERTASVLAGVHRLEAADLLGDCPTRTNRSFLPTFEAAWTDPAFNRHLPPHLRSAGWLYDLMTEPFFEREGGRLLPVDAQPKNVQVSDTGGVYLIDVDYSCGNPALGLGQFLASLDRLGLRYPTGRAAGRIASWKRCFLAAYAREAPPEVLEDLVFFYPWSLLRMYARHAARRPWVRWYLARYYAGCLSGFAASAGRACQAEIARSPGTVFAVS